MTVRAVTRPDPTTAVAAALHNRRYIGIELKQEYFKEAQRNIKEVKKIMKDKKGKK